MESRQGVKFGRRALALVGVLAVSALGISLPASAFGQMADNVTCTASSTGSSIVVKAKVRGDSTFEVFNTSTWAVLYTQSVGKSSTLVWRTKNTGVSGTREARATALDYTTSANTLVSGSVQSLVPSCSTY